MAKKQSKGGVFALEFIGSLFYLLVVYQLIAGAIGFSALFSNTGSFWLPVFESTAVLASIALLFYSFTYLSNNVTHITVMGKSFDSILVCAAGFTLVALTMGNSSYLALTLIGFIIAFLGVLLSEFGK
jgi:hypothetical protein